MMAIVPDRGPLTEKVLDQLRTSGQTVGDGVMPDENWIGQPNLPGSEFRPFAVLSERTADRSDGPIGASQGDWRMPYMVEFFGVSRKQVTWIADKLRGTLDSLRFDVYTLGPADYKVQLIRHDNIGQPQRIDVTDPPFWHQQDGVTLWIGKEIVKP